MRRHGTTSTYSFVAGGLAGRAVSSTGGGGAGSGRDVTVGGGPLGERSGRGGAGLEGGLGRDKRGETSSKCRVFQGHPTLLKTSVGLGSQA